MRRASAIIWIFSALALSAHSAESARVQVDHTTAAALIAADPAQASAAGRALFCHEFTTREGAGEARVHPGVPAMRAARAQSCIVCHNVPYGDAGAGATIGRSGPSGRNTPHLFGAGAVEQLGEAITAALLTRADRDGDGSISRAEADAAGRALVDPDGGNGSETTVDFGAFADADHDGRPDLDPALRVWFVDRDGRRLPGARTWDDPGANR